MMNETISVVIPAFNAAASLGKAIKSALSAGVGEIIVVDDGSTDGSGAIAESYGCRVLRQVNQGAATARRAGIAAVSNTFVVLLDADDEIVPLGLGAAIAELHDDQACGLVIGTMIGVTAAGRTLRYPVWPEGVTTETLIARGHSPAPPASIIWRATALRLVLNDEKLPGIWPRYAEDYELVLRASLLTNMTVIDEPLCRYAVTGGKSSTGAVHSVADSDRIRVHYARVAGVETKPRSRRQNAALVAMKKYSETIDAPLLQRVPPLMRATALDPKSMTGRIKRALARALSPIRVTVKRADVFLPRSSEGGDPDRRDAHRKPAGNP